MFGEVKAWAQRHRREIVITASIVVIIGGIAIFVINGKKVKMPIADVAEKLILETPTKLAKQAVNVTVEIDGVMKTFPRSEFIRKLHDGWKASVAKVAQAAEMGIDLMPGETIVNACIVTMKAI